MASGRWMARYARWHIWLGWLVGVPLLLWTLSGVAMVARPIEEVRGEHLRDRAQARSRCRRRLQRFAGVGAPMRPRSSQRMQQRRAVRVDRHRRRRPRRSAIRAAAQPLRRSMRGRSAAIAARDYSRRRRELDGARVLRRRRRPGRLAQADRRLAGHAGRRHLRLRRQRERRDRGACARAGGGSTT